MAPSPTPDNGEGSSRQPRSTTPVSTTGIRTGSPAADAGPRHASIARLASPVPSPSPSYTSKQLPIPAEQEQDLRKVENQSSLPGPGQSMIASGLHDTLGRSSPRLGTPPRGSASPTVQNPDKAVRSTYGSFDNKPGTDSPDYSDGPHEDPEVVKRHLVLPQHVTDSRPPSSSKDAAGNGSDEFSSLKLQGGDMTRQVYRWAEDAENGASPWKALRSKSFSHPRPTPEDETMDINTIRVPGGFRRDYIRRAVGSPYPESAQG